MEAGRRVIKSGTRPTRGVVALGAILREAGLHMVRSRGALEVRLMAGDARRAGQAVSARRAERSVMALGALQRDVRTRQREAGRRMIKSCTVPGGGAMALLAGRREAGLHVVRTGRAIEVLHMA